MVRVNSDFNTGSHYLQGLNISRGLIESMSRYRKFGQNPEVGTESTEVIWAKGGDYTFLTEAEKLKVSSDNAADVNATGAGAWKVLVIGLDSDLNEIEEEVELNGVTAVVTTQEFFRVNRAYITETGNTAIFGNNTGNISVNNNANDNTLAYIPAGEGQTQQMIFTIPAGHTAFINYSEVSVIDRKTRIQRWIKQHTSENSPWRSISDRYLLGEVNAQCIPPCPIHEKTDVILTAENVDASQTSSVAVILYMTLIKNT